MSKEPSQDTQPAKPQRLDLEVTQAHRAKAVDTESSQPSLEDTQPSAPPPKGELKRGRLDLRRIARNTGLIAAGVLVLLIALYRIAPPPQTNILILGIDARPGEGWMARSDSLMLVTIDPARMYVGMLSIPRDLYVDIPGGYAANRINTAHMLGEEERPGGGPALAARAVEHNFGVPVHHVMRLKFDGFLRIIDAAGGVTINVPRRIVDADYPTANGGVTTVVFEPGWQRMDGERALAYVRTRHADNDRSRGQRQQDVVVALIYALILPDRWVYWPAVSAAVAANVETDLTVWDAVALAPVLVWVGPGGIDRQTLDDSMVTSFVTSGGASMLAPDWKLIRPLIERMFGAGARP